MRVAVSGAAGFIGRHVVSDLLHGGHEVIAVVRNARGIDERVGVTWVEMDLRGDCGGAYERLHCPDALIHLAWGGLPNYRSSHHFEQELPASYRFISTLVNGGLGNVVVAGTCFEYGLQSGQLSEDMADPVLPYAFAKDALRRQLDCLREKERFAFTWARLFYLFGDGQAQASLLPQLRRALEEDRQEFPMSGGEQLRDFLDVGEAANLLVQLAVRQGDIGIVNVCSGVPVSVRSFVEKWLIKNSRSIRLVLGQYPYPDYEPMAFWGSREKLDCFLELVERSSA